MLKTIKGLILLFVMMGMLQTTHAQSNYSPDAVKAAYILNFLKLVNWPNESEFDTFHIALLENDSSLYHELNRNASNKQIKNKNIHIFLIKKDDQLPNAQLLYIDEPSKVDINTQSVFNAILGKNMLLVTDENNLQYSMINFVNRRNTIRFELNDENLKRQNLTISGLLVTMSRNKTELKELYLETEKMLETEKKMVEKQKQEIEEQKAKITEQTRLLEKQQKELAKQQKEIDIQKAEILQQNQLIDQKQKEIEKQNLKLGTLNFELTKQQSRLKERLDLIDMQDNKIKEQSNKINAQLDVMGQLNQELDRKLDEINQKNNVLSEKDSKIYNQRLVITLSFMFIGITFFLTVLMLRAFRAKSKINRELNEKNKAIISQNVEIKQQQEEILSQNEEIERQKENLEKTQEEIQKAYHKIEEKNNLLEIRNRYITDGIQYAQKIQESIFPSHTLIKSVFPDSFILFLPKDILSGDFYFFDKTFTQPNEDSYRNEEIVFFASVDCTGHGVPGALMSIVGYNLLNQAINEYKILQPSKILDFLNSGVQNTLRQSDDSDENVKDGMDIALCVYNRSNNILEFAGAFNPLYLFRNNELVEYKPDIRPIGSSYHEKVVPFKNHHIKLQKGDVIYIFSDGYADQFGGKDHTKFMRKRLRNLLFDNHQLPMAEQKQILKDVFFQWKGDLEQYDDVLIMGFRI